MMQNNTAVVASAEAVSGKPESHNRGIIRAVLSGWAGTSLEYFDFQLYGLAAALVFNRLFFPNLSPTLGLISSFGTYAIGFLARPVGAIYFGRLGDRVGRKAVLVTTISLMGVSTCGIGLLPTHDQIGIAAPLLLVLLRLLQGLGAGAELAGASVLLSEYATPRTRGLVSSFICLGTNSGTLIASGVWLLLLMLPEQQLLSWGWRIPFIASILVTGAALFIRRHLAETPVFEAARKKEEGDRKRVQVEHHPFREVLAHGWRPLLGCISLRLAESGPSAIFQSFLLGYIATVLMMDRTIGTEAVFIGSIVGYVTVPLAGWLSDRFGRRIVYRVITLLQCLFAFPALMLLNTKDPLLMSLTLICGLSIGILSLFSVQSAYMPELFGSRYRYTGLAAAKEFGAILSGGTAPMVVAALMGAFGGSWIPVSVYLLVMSAIGFIGTFLLPETRGRDLALPEDAF